MSKNFSPHSNSQKKIPKIVITGPPGAGKSSVLKFFREDKKNQVQCVPESATMAIEGLGILPGTQSADFVLENSFQYMMYRMQDLFEDISEQIARRENKKTLILEKGCVDIVAHLKGGIGAYEKLFKTTLKKDRNRYDLILFLELAPPKDYEIACRNKQSRRESYKQAKLLEKKVKNVWKEHPNFVCIRSEPKWNKKLYAVRLMIERFLDNLSQQN